VTCAPGRRVRIGGISFDVVDLQIERAPPGSSGSSMRGLAHLVEVVLGARFELLVAALCLSEGEAVRAIVAQWSAQLAGSSSQEQTGQSRYRPAPRSRPSDHNTVSRPPFSHRPKMPPLRDMNGNPFSRTGKIGLSTRDEHNAPIRGKCGWPRWPRHVREATLGSVRPARGVKGPWCPRRHERTLNGGSHFAALSDPRDSRPTRWTATKRTISGRQHR
jgi:hypothetical protein